MKYSSFSTVRAMVFYVGWVTAAFASTMYLVERPELTRMPAIIAAACLVLSFVLNRVYTTRHVLQSSVAGFTGACLPVWLNNNQVCIWQSGLTGFFRTAKKVPGMPLYVGVGKEFHGKVTDGTVLSTERKNDWDDMNVHGTVTGRWSSSEELNPNTPKCA